MRVYVFAPFLVVLFLGLMAPLGHAQQVPPSDISADIPNEILIANFDSGNKPNNVGGDFGSWNYAPNDDTQGCWDFFRDVNYDGHGGKSIELEHDVASPNPAFCGFWMKLGNIDLTPYDMLTFWAKGSEKDGFTSRFKIELKTKRGGRAVYTISGVTEEWQSFSIPFKQTRAIKDWGAAHEVTFVFDDIMATKKTGKIYVDQMTFRKFSADEASQYGVAESQRAII